MSIHAKDAVKILRHFKKLNTLSGPGVINTPTTITINPPAPRRSSPSTTKRTLHGLITGATQDGSNKRWTYTFEEKYKQNAGYGGWSTLTGGKSGDAFNYIEDANDSSGLYGNGVNSSNLSGTFDVQPCPTGTVVVLDIVTTGDGTVEYWFNYTNGIDGGC